jgi:RING finger family protein
MPSGTGKSTTLRGCSICYNAISHTQPPVEASCKHAYHRTCIMDSALRQFPNALRCPVCDGRIYTLKIDDSSPCTPAMRIKQPEKGRVVFFLLLKWARFVIFHTIVLLIPCLIALYFWVRGLWNKVVGITLCSWVVFYLLGIVWNFIQVQRVNKAKKRSQKLESIMGYWIIQYPGLLQDFHRTGSFGEV